MYFYPALLKQYFPCMHLETDNFSIHFATQSDCICKQHFSISQQILKVDIGLFNWTIIRHKLALI